MIKKRLKISIFFLLLVLLTGGFLLRMHTAVSPAGYTATLIELPEVQTGDEKLEELIYQRSSIRSYQDQPVTISKLAAILWSTVGVTVDGTTGPTRAAPSAGATDPLSVYLVAGMVDDLEAGLYRYLPQEHALEQVIDEDIRDRLSSAALGQEAISEAPVVVIIAADYQRTTSRYGERGQRYVHFEAGHAAQNATLMAMERDLGSVIIGAFDDGRVKSLLQLEHNDPLLLIPMGKGR